jgi:hypothetical protein
MSWMFEPMSPEQMGALLDSILIWSWLIGMSLFGFGVLLENVTRKTRRVLVTASVLAVITYACAPWWLAAFCLLCYF